MADVAQPPNSVAVMFSGGRDSSLAAITYASRGRRVHLLRFVTGLGIPSPLPDLREQELRAAFPECFAATCRLPAYGLVRKIALAHIEEDFRRFQGKNLVLLGEKLAIHTWSIIHCLRTGIRTLADGTSGYQTDMPEQRQVAIDFFTSFSQEHSISYETPITAYESIDDVKYKLFEHGVSTKSLEGLSMFADSFSRASDSLVLEYLEAKIDVARKHIRDAIHGFA